jgi:hypothetical protein
LQTVVGELQVALQQLLPAQTSFEQALDEGARILHPEFGLAGGTAAGPDPADGYDASEWQELDTPRGVLQAKVEPWLAKSTSSTTSWTAWRSRRPAVARLSGRRTVSST